MPGELQIEKVTSLPPAAPVPAYIENVRQLKCMLRGSIPYCGVHDREEGGSPFDSSWFIWKYAKNRTQRQVYFNSSVANHQREAEPRRHREGVEK